MSEEMTQTSVEDVKVEETTDANPQETGAEKTVNPTDEPAAATEVDYKTKFSESSKEALRLLEENREKEEELVRLRKLAEKSEPSSTSYGDDSESLYPGFENLSEEEQKNLMAYTEGIKQRALQDVYKDPAIAFAKNSYNEKKWNDAFEKISVEYPDLVESKDEFKSKYFKADNVPDNIENILRDVAKIHLFDKAKDIGAKQAAEQSERIDIERSKGGDKAPSGTSRSLEDWYHLASSNPAEFAKHSEQFNKDIASGKLK